MKRCPECRRDYTDETLNFCLDDGSALLQGPANADEPATAIFIGKNVAPIPQASSGVLWGAVSSARQPGNSIAVLPFSNISADPDNEYFCEGLAEELLNGFAKIEQLKVASRTSAFSFKGKNTTIAEIARLLNVNTVLEGSVRKIGRRVRITAQLISAADDSHLWSERYDRDLEDVFEVQEEITLAIVDALKVKLFGEEKSAVLKRGTDDIEAYELFLRGRFHLAKRTEEGLKTSVGYFENAIERNPRYALALAGLADSYCLLSIYGIVPTTEGFEQARNAAEKALSIDDQLAEAHASLGPVRHDGDWDFAGAEREYKLAIRFNPNYATAHHWYAEFLGSVGRLNEALLEIARAKSLDPLSLIINTDHGKILSWAGRMDEAVEALRKALEISPEFAGAHVRLGEVFTRTRSYVKALEHFQKASSIDKTPIVLAKVGHILGLLGRRKQAEDVVAELAILKQSRHVPSSCYALIYSGLGETDTAFDWLEAAYEERDEAMIWLKVTPEFDALRTHERFENLLERVGYPD
jgi:adenylate cyclase